MYMAGFFIACIFIFAYLESPVVIPIKTSHLKLIAGARGLAR